MASYVHVTYEWMYSTYLYLYIFTFLVKMVRVLFFLFVFHISTNRNSKINHRAKHHRFSSNASNEKRTAKKNRAFGFTRKDQSCMNYAHEHFLALYYHINNYNVLSPIHSKINACTHWLHLSVSTKCVYKVCVSVRFCFLCVCIVSFSCCFSGRKSNKNRQRFVSPSFWHRARQFKSFSQEKKMYHIRLCNCIGMTHSTHMHEEHIDERYYTIKCNVVIKRNLVHIPWKNTLIGACRQLASF